MSDHKPNPDPAHDQDAEARAFYETLEKNGQLVDVQPGEDTTKLSPDVTHVRYPDGSVKRIRFTGSGSRYRGKQGTQDS